MHGRHIPIQSNRLTVLSPSKNYRLQDAEKTENFFWLTKPTTKIRYPNAARSNCEIAINQLSREKLKLIWERL